MIVKILARHSPTYKNLISYIINNEKSNDSKAHVITHNLRSRDIEGYTREFIENEASRRHPRDGQVYMYHEILSLSKDENKEAITRDIMEAITREYINLRGIDGVYLASIHEDKEHAHVHVMSSGVKFRTGLAHRASHQQLREIKIGLQEFHRERFPELTKSSVNHGVGKSYQSDREWQATNREQRSLLKESISQKVQDCFAKSRTKSEFLDKLKEENIHHYERNGKITGIISPEGLKYRFTRLDIDIDQLPESPKEILEEKKTLKLIENIRNENQSETVNNTNMNAISKNFALWQYSRGGMIEYNDTERQAYIITAENTRLPISLEIHQTIVKLEDNNQRSQIHSTGIELSAVNEKIFELLTAPKDEISEQEWNEKMNSLVKEAEQLREAFGDLRVKSEKEFLTTLELEEEIALLKEIEQLSYGNSDHYQIYDDRDIVDEHSVDPDPEILSPYIDDLTQDVETEILEEMDIEEEPDNSDYEYDEPDR